MGIIVVYKSGYQEYPKVLRTPDWHSVAMYTYLSGNYNLSNVGVEWPKNILKNCKVCGSIGQVWYGSIFGSVSDDQKFIMWVHLL